MPVSRKLTHHLIVEYELKNLPQDWRTQVQDVVRTLASNHNLFPKLIEVGQFGTPPKVLVSIRREGAESAWTEAVQDVMRRNVTRVLDAARKEEVDRQVASMRMRPGGGAVAGALVEGYDDGHLDPTQRLARRTRRATLLVDLRAALDRAELSEPAHDVVSTALEHMKQPALWAIWAGLLLKIVEVDVSLPAELKKRVRALL